MKNSGHIIEKVFLDINTSNLKTAHVVKNNISAFLKDELFPMLELLFDEYDLPDSIVRFDRFDISLSVDELQNFEKLKYEISNIAKEKLELHFQPKGSEIKLPNKNLGEDNLEKKEIGTAANHQNIFFYFLKHGFLPWYGREEQVLEFTKTTEWNKNLQNVDFLLKLKQIISADEMVLDRFLLQLSNDNIISFLAKIQRANKKYIKVINRFLGITDQATSHYFLKLILLISTNGDLVLIQQVLQDFVNQITKNNYFFVTKTKLSTTKSVLQYIQNIVPKKLLKEPEMINFSALLALASKMETKTLLEIKTLDIKKEFRSDLKPVNEFLTETEFNFFTKELNEIGIQNAGLVLLHPFLKHFFIQTKITNKQGNIYKNKLNSAVQSLHFLATGNEDFFEGNLILEKFICGLPLKKPIPKRSQLTDEIKNEVPVLLKEVIQRWPALKNCSPNDLRQLFIQRNGKLVKKEKGYKIIVERKAQDLLLENLRWNISMIKLTWRKEIIVVEW